ncbi:elastin-like [Oryza brachyantha]|uniref:elastin-like n=1 Tax=Oryza brachyantha TaxID=4533 RepID=UPI001AD95BA7|nr:elastin-like [Oryza brachyantha]
MAPWHAAPATTALLLIVLALPQCEPRDMPAPPAKISTTAEGAAPAVGLNDHKTFLPGMGSGLGGGYGGGVGGFAGPGGIGGIGGVVGGLGGLGGGGLGGLGGGPGSGGGLGESPHTTSAGTQEAGGQEKPAPPPPPCAAQWSHHLRGYAGTQEARIRSQCRCHPACVAWRRCAAGLPPLAPPRDVLLLLDDVLAKITSRLEPDHEPSLVCSSVRVPSRAKLSQVFRELPRARLGLARFDPYA